MNETNQVVIIGAGQAGGRAALALRDRRYNGNIHLVGEETLPPYQRPPLSKAVLMGKKTVEKTQLTSSHHYTEKDIQLHIDSCVKKIDIQAQSVHFNNKTLDYSHLIIATGSRPRMIDLPGSELRGISTFRTAKDAVNLAKHLKPGAKLLVIGGGFIGLEVAASATQMGCQVTVLEAQDRLLSRSMPEAAANDIVKLHQQHGVEIITDISIERFIGDGHVKAIKLSDYREIEVDIVVVGIGIIPNTELAEQAGLLINNGIVTNEFTCTSNDKIYAVGDCANSFSPRYNRHIRLESSQNADLQSVTAASAICGEFHPYAPVPWLWSQQYNWIIQTAGFTHTADELVKRGNIEDKLVLYFGIEKSKLSAVVGIGQGAAVAKQVRLAQMLIEKNIAIDAATLQDPSLDLKNLLQSNRRITE